MIAPNTSEVKYLPGTKIMDLTGHQYGLLTVLECAGRRNGMTYWKARCECGSVREYPIGNLRSDRSVGCRECQYERRKARPATLSTIHKREHHIWHGMIARCTNEKLKAWKYYGARGIRVCKRWRESFAEFLADMGPRPSPEHSIDRKNNDGNYSCGKCEECLANGWDTNCRWATRLMQARNRGGKRRPHVLTHNGETKYIADWAEELGISRQALFQRLERMPVERALHYKKKRLPSHRELPIKTPPEKTPRYSRIMSHSERAQRRIQIAKAVVTLNSIQKAAEQFGVSYTTARNAFYDLGGDVEARFVLPSTLTEGAAP